MGHFRGNLLRVATTVTVFCRVELVSNTFANQLLFSKLLAGSSVNNRKIIGLFKESYRKSSKNHIILVPNEPSQLHHFNRSIKSVRTIFFEERTINSWWTLILDHTSPNNCNEHGKPARTESGLFSVRHANRTFCPAGAPFALEAPGVRIWKCSKYFFEIF